MSDPAYTEATGIWNDGPQATATGHPTGGMVRKSVDMAKGAGDSIRGNINTTADAATGNHAAAARNRAIADQGAHRMAAARAPKYSPDAPATGPQITGPTGYGPHSANVANVTGPPIGSDTVHIGTGAETAPEYRDITTGAEFGYDGEVGSTGADRARRAAKEAAAKEAAERQTTGQSPARTGPPNTNTSKLDPHAASDPGHHHVHSGTTGGTTAGHTGMTETHHSHPHHKSHLLNKLDPRVKDA